MITDYGNWPEISTIYSKYVAPTRTSRFCFNFDSDRIIGNGIDSRILQYREVGTAFGLRGNTFVCLIHADEIPYGNWTSDKCPVEN